ncbi:hypothetical protein FQN57_006725 [Myotisia sp. PD_48]|nr:hypothetical protein FQN57_006725 [Myotisia sp. PD_48]
MAAHVPTVKLNDGSSIPILGYGTGTAWIKKGDANEVDRSVVEATKTAIRLGYRHLDGAEMYKTEKELGLAIKESNIPRDQFFVTAKASHNIGDVYKAIDETLDKMQLDYVDLFLIHSPFFAKTDEELQAKWADMEAIKQSGKARSIGVSNFVQSHLDAILKTARVRPAVNQIEYHPYLQHGNILATQQAQGIITEGFGPLAPLVRARGGPIDETVVRLAKKYGVSEGAILVRWSIDRGVVTITTSGKEDRLKEYLSVMDFQLTNEEVFEIARRGEQKHFRAYWTKDFAPDDRS